MEKLTEKEKQKRFEVALKLFVKGYTQVKIAKEMGFSKQIISDLKNEMIERGLITEEEIKNYQQKNKEKDIKPVKKINEKKQKSIENQEKVLELMKKNIPAKAISIEARIPESTTYKIIKRILDEKLITEYTPDDNYEIKLPDIEINEELKEEIIKLLKDGYVPQAISSMLNIDTFIISMVREEAVKNGSLNPSEIIEAIKNKKQKEKDFILEKLNEGFSQYQIGKMKEIRGSSNTSRIISELVEEGLVSRDQLYINDPRKNKSEYEKFVLEGMKKGLTGKEIADIDETNYLTENIVRDIRKMLFDKKLITKEEAEKYKKQYEEEYRKLVQKGLDEGLSIREIVDSDKTGYLTNTKAIRISKELKANKQDYPKKEVKNMGEKIDIKKIMNMKKEGYSTSEIADELNMEEEYVAKYIKQKESLEQIVSSGQKHVNQRIQSRYQRVEEKVEKTYEELKNAATDEMNENSTIIVNRRLFIETLKKQYKEKTVEYDDLLLAIEMIKGEINLYSIENIAFITTCLTDIEKYDVAEELVEYCMTYYRVKHGVLKLVDIKKEINRVYKARRAIEMVKEDASLEEIENTLCLTEEELKDIKEDIGRFLVDNNKKNLKEKYKIDHLPSKSLQNLYSYFDLYSKEDVYDAVMQLPEKHKTLLFKYYSQNLIRKKGIAFTTKDSGIFYGALIRRLKKILSEKQKDNKKDNQTKTHNKTDDLTLYFNMYSKEEIYKAIESLSQKDRDFVYTYYSSDLIRLDIPIPKEDKPFLYNLLTRIRKKLEYNRKIIGLQNKEEKQEDKETEKLDDNKEIGDIDMTKSDNEQTFNISFINKYFSDQKINIVDLAKYMEIPMNECYAYRMGTKEINIDSLNLMLEFLNIESIEDFIEDIPERYFTDVNMDKETVRKKFEISKPEENEKTNDAKIFKDSEEKKEKVVETNIKDNAKESDNLKEGLVVQNNDIIDVLEIFDTPEFVERTMSKPTEESLPLSLQLGYFKHQYYSSSALANFLNVDISEIKTLFKNTLIEYEKILMDMIDAEMNDAESSSSSSMVLRDENERK